ncbi:hypothetical protein [Ferrimonas sp. SCSIO 43195]|uniref:hypothetical protein n=1 Tax=Ferrimonas sp. SCSIO 43195 TaxID=2822844 RepID=UPI0020757DEA|nr:hypothetical protein [Ferrimonas sp. SCSIO 43195]USD38715.1 hypothetical protein J8Z22_06320 [Ferrimonas sp. SCSIO 43195]
MDGRAFFRLLARRGIPCSSLALKTQTRLSHLYGLRQARRIPAHYLEALSCHYGHQLTAGDVARLASSMPASGLSWQRSGRHHL